MIDWYILDEKHNPFKVDLLTGARALEYTNRHVDVTNIGDVRISTVFLGLDHGYGRAGPPLLFETMIFGGENDGYQERYCTWDEASRGHGVAVDLIRGDQNE